MKNHKIIMHFTLYAYFSKYVTHYLYAIPHYFTSIYFTSDKSAPLTSFQRMFWPAKPFRQAQSLTMESLSE